MADQHNDRRGADVEVADLNNIWYHGTTIESANEIINTGEFRVSDDKPEHAFDVSVSGRVYVTKSMEIGVVYGSERVGIKEKFVVLQICLKDPSLVWPDEVEVGSVTALGLYDWRMEDRYGDDIPDENYPVMPEDENIALHWDIWERLPDGYKKYLSSIDDKDLLELETAVNIGLSIIEYFHRSNPEYFRKLLEYSSSVTTLPDNIVITGGWVGTLGDFQRHIVDIGGEMDPSVLDRSMILHNDRFPISTRGIGKGWHNDPYRHALAARGVRTR